MSLTRLDLVTAVKHRLRGTNRIEREVKNNGTSSTLENAPSAELVYKVLEWNGELTQCQITEELMLPQRTVRHALTKLENENLIDKRLSFRDTRQRLYSLPEADTD